jgi:hypothetical protein
MRDGAVAAVIPAISNVKIGSTHNSVADKKINELPESLFVFLVNLFFVSLCNPLCGPP